MCCSGVRRSDFIAAAAVHVGRTASVITARASTVRFLAAGRSPCVISAGAAFHTAGAAAGAALDIPAIDECLRTVRVSHRSDLTIRKSCAVTVKPGPVFRVSKPVNIILQALLELCQVQIQVGTVIAVGIFMSGFVIFDSESDRIRGITVAVQIETDF